MRADAGRELPRGGRASMGGSTLRPDRNTPRFAIQYSEYRASAVTIFLELSRCSRGARARVCVECATHGDGHSKAVRGRASRTLTLPATSFMFIWRGAHPPLGAAGVTRDGEV